MPTAGPCDNGTVPYLLAAIVAAAAAAVGWLARPLPPDPEERRRIGAAVSAGDRELAANLELTTMFDQTKQAGTPQNRPVPPPRPGPRREAPPAPAGVG